MKLTDIDTASLLQEFKDKYFAPIEKMHIKYMAFNELPEAEAKKAKDIETRYHFLTAFMATIEATLEQNLVLKVENKRVNDKIIANEKFYESNINNLVKQIPK